MPDRQAVGSSNLPPRDLQRTFRLVLATLWLLDAVLQVQPFMFTPGARGFSGMLSMVASGNPGWVAHSIRWNAAIVDHHPIWTNASFALVQFSIGFGIALKRTCKPALALSVVWSVAVWWFGEGAGRIFAGSATPLGGGPGAVLFYGLLAVLLWPSDSRGEGFVAARTVGSRAATAIWVVTWTVLAILCVAGSGRSPQALSGLVAGLDSNEPGWLASIDRASGSMLLHDGTALAIMLAVLCLALAASVYFPAHITRCVLVVGITVFAVIWVAVQDLGGILASGATDPNAGPLVTLLALIYWPLDHRGPSAGSGMPDASVHDVVAVVP